MRIPFSSAISALTLAELITGAAAAVRDVQRAHRWRLVQVSEAAFETVPFDPRCARAYGRIYAAVAAIDRKPRGGRAVDLMIAATALAYDLPLYTLNAADLRGLERLIEIVDLA